VIQELIRDRLRISATQQIGITLSEGELQSGLSEFAARAEQTAEEFVETLESAGVARETLRDFVATQLIWRDFIRARFGARVQISEREVDRAVASTTSSTGIEVLISEIIIPAPAELAAEVMDRIARKWRQTAVDVSE
jgi:peptidyl-prolyl cis-trans isomerase SurA